MKLNGLIRTAATGAATAALYAWTALPAFAQDAAPAAPPAPKLDSGDTAWMLTSMALVLMMTIPGLALFYGGMVRKKNVLSVLMQTFVTTCLVTVLWVVVAYSLAFRTNPDDFYNAYFGGFDRVLLAGMGKDTLQGTIPESVFMCFQMTFAIITPALIIGSIVDRMKFSALIIFMCAVADPRLRTDLPIGCGAAASLQSRACSTSRAARSFTSTPASLASWPASYSAGARATAPRTWRRFNLVLTVIGASLLWVGWFGFNAGSAVAANGAAGMAMTVTQVATATAALAWMFAEWLVHGKPSVLGIASGAVAGLVAITPASGFVDCKGALVIGAAAGVGCYISATGLKRLLGYDDSLDVFGVHCIGGIIGALLTGVFAVQAIGGTAGVLEGNFAQLPIQAYGVMATLIWSGAVSFILMVLLRLTIGVRVPESAEVEGLDLALHGETVQ